MSTTAMFMTAVLPAARAVPSRASCGRARRGRALLRCDAVAADWREKARPITPGGVYPAKEHCSSCGLCDTYYVAHVKDACAFLGDGMSRVETLEPTVHGRGRDLSNDELRLGVVDEVFYARKTAPVEGAQWTGIVTSIAIEMLTSGKVEGVVCVASQPDDPMRPRPILATTTEEILSSKGVKPSLSPNLEVLAEVEARGLKRLLFIGVGCAVTALRGVEPYLGLDALYVVGTNCTDNGRAETLPKFLAAASDDPATVTGYEFMQDYRVHLKHADGRFEKVPYFCLPANDLKDVIAPSCYSCFDYVNGLADLVVGYMGVPMSVGVEMTAHPQYVTVRNARGKELFDSVREKCEVTPSVSSGNRTPFVVQTVVADDEAMLVAAPPGAPHVGTRWRTFWRRWGPRGRSSACTRWITTPCATSCTSSATSGATRERTSTSWATRRIVDEYNENGAVDARLAITARPVRPLTPLAPPSGRTPALGGDERDASPFGEIDPSVIGGVLGFVLVSAIASKVMGVGPDGRDCRWVPTVEYSLFFVIHASPRRGQPSSARGAFARQALFDINKRI